MSSEPQFTADASLRLSSSRQWPGERNPKQSDVDDANESPASVFLERFRAALVHSASVELDGPFEVDIGAIEAQIARATAIEPYTYPMALLLKTETMPTEDELARLQAVFGATFKHHILIRDIELPGNGSSSPSPYLRFAYASLACLFSPSNESGVSRIEDSSRLFLTGVHLWIVMVECDNREARMIDTVVAAALLITFGVLSADRHFWKKSSGLLCNIVTIVKRMHLTDGYSPIYTSGNLVERDVSMKSSLISYILLMDTLQVVHCNSVPNLSINEFFIRMPTSDYEFRKVYGLLNHGAALPADVCSREDALLLLTALLSDIMYTQKCYLAYSRSETGGTSGNSLDGRSLVNPYAPLTSQSEYSRLSTMFDRALSRWEQHFQRQAGGDIFALYRFTRMQLLCPSLCELPLQVGYGRMSHIFGSTDFGLHGKDIHIPDGAVDLAWLALDDLDSPREHGERRLSIWLPIVIFMSALVVWKKLRSQKNHQIKVLNMFKDEIAQFPWPCCVEMATTLDKLVRS